MKIINLITNEYIYDNCVQVMFPYEEYNILDIYLDWKKIEYENDPRRHMFPYNTIPSHVEKRTNYKNFILDFEKIYVLKTGASGMKWRKDELLPCAIYSYPRKTYYIKVVRYDKNAIIFMGDNEEEIINSNIDELDEKKIKRTKKLKISSSINKLKRKEIIKSKKINYIDAIKLKHQEEIDLLCEKYDKPKEKQIVKH